MVQLKTIPGIVSIHLAMEVNPPAQDPSHNQVPTALLLHESIVSGSISQGVGNWEPLLGLRTWGLSLFGSFVQRGTWV